MKLTIKPNVPLYVALEDPEAPYDFDMRQTEYRTTTGDILVLPRPAVIAVNACEPQPGEEIQIVKHWSGRPGDGIEWTVCLSARSENARAQAETQAQDAAAEVPGPPEPQSTRKRATEPVTAPTPIRKAPKHQDQPRLFDRGTGTHGPAPMPIPQAEPARRFVPIPANVAVREILSFIAADPNTRNWSDQARQDLASTIIIAAYKAGHVGLWERNV